MNTLRFRCFLFFIFVCHAFSLNAAWKNSLAFTENKGQVRVAVNDSAIRVYFTLSSPVADYYFTDKGYSVVQRGDSGKTNTTRFDFDEEIMFRRNSIIPEGEARANGVVNIITENTIAVARTFSSITYRNIFDGCDLVFSVNGDQLERKFIVRNKMHQYDILFHVTGSDVQPIADENNAGYSFANPCGTFTETLASHPYFEVSDVRSKLEWSMDKVECEYELSEDPNDPQTSSVISWLTYLGGSSSDEMFALAITPDSGAVVAGRTSSLNFPVTPGAYCDTFNLNYDVTLARFASNGNCVWCTYYGGNDFDGAYGIIRIDTNYIVCGSTNSTTLPMIGASQSSNAGSYDGFLAVFSASGMLLHSTYYGGTGGDQFFAMALDTSGRICVAGSSSSNNFPNTTGQYQPSLAGAIDATLAVFDSQLNPVWATYYGGNSSEDIHSITTSPNGEIIFAGGTYSNNFPVTANAFQNGMLSVPDCYLVKFGMDGSRHYATFFGGSNSEDCNGVVADSAGGVYVTGFTYSFDFPIMGNSFQSNHAAQTDVFVSKFDAAGQMMWSTFIGGTGMESGLALERKGKYIYISGNTESATFPVSANAIQVVNAGTSDGFVMKMDTAGNMVSGTFMGGSGVDALYGIGVTNDTSVIACGTTYSTDLPVQNAYQSANMAQGDGYVVKFGMSEQNIGNESNGVAADADLILKLYPVPVHNVLNYSSNGNLPMELTMYDLSGKVVLLKTLLSASGVVDVHDVAAGTYIVAFSYHDGKKQFTQIVKK